MCHVCPSSLTLGKSLTFNFLSPLIMASLTVVSIPSQLVLCSDTYKSIQNRKSQGQSMEKTTEELSPLRSNHSTIRRFSASTSTSPPTFLDNCPPTNPPLMASLLTLCPCQARLLSFSVRSSLMTREHTRLMILSLTPRETKVDLDLLRFLTGWL